MTGVCAQCGQVAHYVTTTDRGMWVHTDTGSYLSRLPEPHDVNTHVIRAGAELLAQPGGIVRAQVVAAAREVDRLTKHRAEVGTRLRKAVIETGKLRSEYEHAQSALTGALFDLGQALEATNE